MDEVYRKYRITVIATDRWRAKITHVRGHVAPFSASAAIDEGAGICLQRARSLVDQYLQFLSGDTLDSDDLR